MMLKKEELKRYSRQTILPEIGLLGQEKLKNAKVLMIGAGGLGCPVLHYLVAAGIGNIGVIDDDVVSISNLHRQILYSFNDIGQLKVIVAKKKLELLNEDAAITAYAERLTLANAEQLFGNYDLVIDGSDNFETRYLVNDTCVSLQKPLVFGSIFKFEGQLSVFNYQNGPNYRDLFPEPPTSEEIPNCAEAGVIGVLPGIIGTYMANEAIKIIVGFGETLSGSLLTLNTLNNSFEIFKISGRNEQAASAKPSTPSAVASQEITIKELENLSAESTNDIQLVDVRENYEFEEFNVGGINIPLHELNDHLPKLLEAKKLVFYCETGRRSKMATQLLKSVFSGEMYILKSTT